MEDDETDVVIYQRADDDVQSYRYSPVSIPDYYNEGCREDDRWLCRDGAGKQRRQHDVAKTSDVMHRTVVSGMHPYNQDVLLFQSTRTT